MELTRMNELYQDMRARMSELINPNLADAWIAFLSGDHPKLVRMMKHLQDTRLDTVYDMSSFHALQAFYTNILGETGGMAQAEAALSVLPETDTSIISANAHLTLGQFSAGHSQLRKAVQHFHLAAEHFDRHLFDFPAVVSLTNEALNTLRLGNLKTAEAICKKRLIQSSTFSDQGMHHASVLLLPLGLCEVARGRFSLAAKHLTEALSAINDMGMLHMHGLVEHALFSAKLSSGDISGAEDISNVFHQRFQRMASSYLNLLMAWFRIRLACEKQLAVSLADLELCQKEFEKSPEQIQHMAIDAYLHASTHQPDHLFPLLATRLKHFRFIGDRLAEAETLMALASLNERVGHVSDMENCLLEAKRIEAETGICIKPYPLHAVVQTPSEVPSTTISSDAGTQQPALLLSAREIELLKAVCKGMSNADIGKNHFISVATVKWHLHNIFGKLQIENRVQAIAKAKELGYFDS